MKTGNPNSFAVILSPHSYTLTPMDATSPRSMEASFENRLGLLSTDDDFDPVLELRRLRQDLMRRLQLLQQSLHQPETVVEKTVSTVVSTHVSEQTNFSGNTGIAVHVDEKIVDDQKNSKPYSIPTRDETALYVAPTVREESLVSRELRFSEPKSQEPTVKQVFEYRDAQLSETKIQEVRFTETSSTTVKQESVVEIRESHANEAVVSEAMEVDDFETRSDLDTDSQLAWMLGWINVIMVGVGICFAAWGLPQFALNDSSGVGLTACLVGGTLVLIGIVGRILQNRADEADGCDHSAQPA